MTKKHWLHILFWIFFCLLIELLFTIRITGQVISVDYDSTTRTNFLLRPYRLQLMGLPTKIAFFYINLLLILPLYARRKKIGFYILKLLAIAIVFYSIDYLVITKIYLNNLPTTIYIAESYDFYLFKMLPLLYFLILGISTSYFFVTQWITNEKQKRESISLQLTNELALLKYQINPHFLFNTLNNLFSIAQKHEIRELESGIATLAGLMRFMIYESNTEKISLHKEVQYIKDYIGLYKLKLDASDFTELSFIVEGKTENRSIAPFLLIPLVENAIKHGLNFKYRSIVKINLLINDNELTFTIVNTTHDQTKFGNDEHSGIGLKNVSRRLSLIYPDQHQLDTRAENGYFFTNLKITLS